MLGNSRCECAACTVRGTTFYGIILARHVCGYGIRGGLLFNLIIVEDEDITRLGLRDCVSWEDYDINVVFEASDGLEALQFIEQNHVDIVLTDVKMPLMDGIELVERIRENNKNIKVIFISGHWDMQYLKSAFHLEAIDYILKPIIPKELHNMLTKVTQLCIQEQQQEELFNEMKDKLEQSMPVLRERFFSELINERYYSKEEVIERSSFLEIILNPNDYYCVMTLVYNPEFIDEKSAKNITLRLIPIREILEEELKKFNAYCINENNNELCIIIQFDSPVEHEQMIDLAKRLKSTVNHSVSEFITIGIGKVLQGIENIGESYRQSLHAAEQSVFLGNNNVIHIADVEKVSRKVGYYSTKDITDIINYVRTGKSEEIKKSVSALFRRLKQNPKIHISYVRNICLELIVTINLQLMEYKVIREDENQEYTWEELFTILNIDEIQEWITNQMVQACEKILSVQTNTSNNIVYMIKKAVEENFCENISIQNLADELFLTPNHLYMLFKKETGETFNQYLTRYRMEKAKEYLSEPKYKLYQITEMVGYSDSDYFTKLFKKHTNYTPSRYRELFVR